MVTALEGNKMARAGRAAAALATAAIGSFVAGTIGTIALTFLAPVVADIATNFGPPEYVALMAVAFVTVSALLGPDLLKGARLAARRRDDRADRDRHPDRPAPADIRVRQLLDGIDVVIVVVALFALGESFGHALTGTGQSTVSRCAGPPCCRGQDFRRSWPAWLRGTAFGFPIGACPPAARRCRPS